MPPSVPPATQALPTYKDVLTTRNIISGLPSPGPSIQLSRPRPRCWRKTCVEHGGVLAAHGKHQVPRWGEFFTQIDDEETHGPRCCYRSTGNHGQSMAYARGNSLASAW